MELGYIWLIASAIMFLMEIFTISFLLFFPAVGAFLAFLCAVFGANVTVQAVVFIISSILLIIFIRPFVTKFFKSNNVAMNSKSVVGKNAVVIKAIDNIHGKGQVKVAGEVWSAVSSTDENIEEGATVIVLKIEGVKLIVKKV